MEMTAVWKERKSRSPFPLFPHCLGKLAKNATFPHSHSLGDDLGFPFSPSSFNFNLNEKCYLHARYLLLPTCPFAQGLRTTALAAQVRFFDTYGATSSLSAVVFAADDWKGVPQRLKPSSVRARCGTAEPVPFVHQHNSKTCFHLDSSRSTEAT